MKEIIQKIIEKNQDKNNKMYQWYKRFRTDSVPIFDRSLPTAQKVNNKINVDYVSQLVNTKVNHFLGNPVSIILDNEDEKLTQILKRFKRYTAFNRVLSELGKQAALYGYGCILAYVDKRGEFDFIEIEPYSCFFGEGIVVREIQSNNENTRLFEVYDEEKIYIYEGKDEKNLSLVEENDHLFQGIPVFKVENNKEEINEFYRVRNIIDNLDKLYSDLSSEVEQFRLAYLKFVGTEPDAETILKMVQTGAIVVPEGCDVGFVTKTMQISEVLKLIEKLEQKLFTVSRSYDSTDTHGAGQLTNLGIHFKLAPINSNCKETIQYFTEGLYTLFDFYGQYLSKKGIELNYLDMDFQFVLDTPRNLLEEAEIQQKLNGNVSTETRLKICTFVENPTEEKKKLDEELSAGIDNNYDFSGSDLSGQE
ncbi:MAG: phage portal protein [Fusobacteriaceae bacterium]